MLGKGNCFSLLLSGEPFAETKIVNMKLEPFEAAIKKFAIKDNLEIEFLDDSKRWAKITDSRIPEKLLDKEYCYACCPKDFWPEEHRRRYDEKVESGDIVESKVGNISTVSFKP